MPIGHINLAVKRSGERSVVNPHAAFDVAGTGNGLNHRGHEYGVT
jgi:hypothetical protein